MLGPEPEHAGPHLGGSNQPVTGLNCFAFASARSNLSSPEPFRLVGLYEIVPVTPPVLREKSLKAAARPARVGDGARLSS